MAETWKFLTLTASIPDRLCCFAELTAAARGAHGVSNSEQIGNQRPGSIHTTAINIERYSGDPHRLAMSVDLSILLEIPPPPNLGRRVDFHTDPFLKYFNFEAIDAGVTADA